MVVQDAPGRWFEQSRGRPRLVIYAHGGLNSESDSVNRIRVLAPYFEANGIYPIFLTWKTGPLETLRDLVKDQVKGLPPPPGANWLKALKEAATEAIDRLHSTAHSHHRIIVVEIMGHNTGWLALGSGIAGGADVILIPEVPYDVNIIAKAIKQRSRNGKNFSIVAVAEGAVSQEEAPAFQEVREQKKNGKTKKES